VGKLSNHWAFVAWFSDLPRPTNSRSYNDASRPDPISPISSVRYTEPLGGLERFQHHRYPFSSADLNSLLNGHSDLYNNQSLSHQSINHNKVAKSKNDLQITVLGEKDEKDGKGHSQKVVSLEELLAASVDHNYSSEQGPPLWFAVSGADDETYRQLGNKFSLHPLTVEDCQSISERGREKLEIFQSYLFLMFELTGLQEVPDHEPISIRLIVFKNCILSFHPRGVPAIRQVKSKIATVFGNRIPNTAWLVHAILDSIIDAMVPVVERVTSDLTYLDLKLYDTEIPIKDHLQTIQETRKQLLFLRQRLWPKRDILTSLINKDGTPFLSGLQLPYLRDVYDHVVTMLEKVERTQDLLHATQSNYLASISVDLSKSSKELNNVMKRLTAWATICLPLGVVTGLFGMNVPVPLQPGEVFHLADPKLYPFYAVTLAISGTAFGLYRNFKKKGFL